MSTAPAAAPAAPAGGHLTAVAGPGVLTGSQTADELLQRALAAHGCTGELVRTRTAADFERAVRAAAAEGEPLVLPADATPFDDVLGAWDARAAVRSVVRVDVDARPHDPSAAVRRHVRSRGLGGLRFGVDAWHHHRTRPAATSAYGPHPDQRLELRLPRDAGSGPFPVAVLVHGGYWRSRWASDLMDAVAVDLADRGWAAVNVEYRRPDEHDWEATTADVAAALQAVAGLEAPLDLGRVVLLGHSAGGQLVVRLAADLAAGLAADLAASPAAPVRPALTVSLAGCLDLESIHDRHLSEGAVALALGGSPAQLPQVYAASSPLRRLPLGSPLAVVCCRGDDPDLLDASRRYAAAARAAGDDVAVLEEDGDHFSVVDPRTRVWQRTLDLVAARVPR
ncbi:alpha/beta hydrolase [Kineococcus sp. SYSU DK006]|uniref:alpha/beta hydrolase n=1 Tax=Kineococcus sp. SYSU DK006 TaxID=3383127 RepID=UPI003D7E56EA